MTAKVVAAACLATKRETRLTREKVALRLGKKEKEKEKKHNNQPVGSEPTGHHKRPSA
jgi:hypothetical protein